MDGLFDVGGRSPRERVGGSAWGELESESESESEKDSESIG
jgi:hypothetical protein